MIEGLALRVELPYAFGHRKAPLCDPSVLIQVAHMKPSFFSVFPLFFSKWYWGAPQSPAKGAALCTPKAGFRQYSEC